MTTISAFSVVLAISAFAQVRTADVATGTETQAPVPAQESLAQWCGHPKKPDIAGMNLREIKPGPGIIVKLRYASDNNFIENRPIYKCVDLDKAYIHAACLNKIQRAAAELQKIDKNKYLIILDAFRPNFAQQKMREWAEKFHPEDTDNWVGKAYNSSMGVEDQRKVSMHVRGLAVDVTIGDKFVTGDKADKQGGIPMGSEHDEFGDCSKIAAEISGKTSCPTLSGQVISNRQKLRKLMADQHMFPLGSEWWHFDCFEKQKLNLKKFPASKY